MTSGTVWAPAPACPVARTRVQSAGRGPARRDHPAQVDPEASYYAFRFSCTQRVSFAQTRFAASDHPRLGPRSDISPRSARFGWEHGSHSAPASSWRITCWGYGAGGSRYVDCNALLLLTQCNSVSGLLHGSRIRRARKRSSIVCGPGALERSTQHSGRARFSPHWMPYLASGLHPRCHCQETPPDPVSDRSQRKRTSGFLSRPWESDPYLQAKRIGRPVSDACLRA